MFIQAAPVYQEALKRALKVIATAMIVIVITIIIKKVEIVMTLRMNIITIIIIQV